MGGGASAARSNRARASLSRGLVLYVIERRVTYDAPGRLRKMDTFHGEYDTGHTIDQRPARPRALDRPVGDIPNSGNNT